jgi:hypothetical protein
MRHEDVTWFSIFTGGKTEKAEGEWRGQGVGGEVKGTRNRQQRNG